MNKLSVIILTKNAETLIADCIDSVSFADEIIVVDDGSTDRTAELAKHLGAKVYSFIRESFAERRNFGLKKAKYKWVLYIDSDERVSKELQENILSVVKDRVKRFWTGKNHKSVSGEEGNDESRIKNQNEEKTTVVAYRLQRKNFYLGKHEWPKIEELERLFDREALVEWVGAVHETPIVKGEIGALPGFLRHYTHQDLSTMVEKTIAWSKIEAELRLKANHPKMSFWRFFRVMLTAFYDSYIKQKGYKVGTAGLIESIYQAFSMFITYARLWELQNTRN